ncbi:beta-1,3-galactosyltransferase 1-like [Portunus trituberculatus]|uniref:beta-1,3-galactosyltransferase 1-like n=1 Tax=Portunus trituberculatus TaxID=210409 RepID=UPI001E1D00A1|nr:beta-1,3-galactosyltransferase 1-like [Portunus trituberculatus]
MLRGRRFRVLGVCVCACVCVVCVVLAVVWWSGGGSELHHHHRYQDVLESTNVSKFLESPRILTLQPLKTQEACSSGGGGVEVLVVVPSSPHNLAARSAVREGWGAYLPHSWALVFYVGAVDRPSVQERLIRESQTHRDIAQDPSFPDSYATLTLKTLALLAWTQQSCPSAKFVLKADDDVFLNVPRLHVLTKCLYSAMIEVYKKVHGDCGGRELVSHYIDARTKGYESYVIGGYLYRNVKTDRSGASKWQLSRSVYAKDTLPNYVSGTAYVLSANIIPHLLEAAKHTPIIHLEDVYLTGLVATEQLKLRLTNIEGFERFRPRFEGPCVYQDLLTAHGFTPGELRAATHSTLGLGNGVCDGVLTKAAIRLNKVLTAIFPKLLCPVLVMWMLVR